MKKLFPLILALLILLTACGKTTDPEISPEPPTVEAPEATATPTPTPEVITNPLTGETIDSDISANRPYAVMLNNIKVALPQCGISKADILYEVLAEGNITRFEAIFSDLNGVGAIGSMRSSRPYYIEIALSFDAIYVHAGGSEQAYSDISSKGVDNIDGVRGAYSGEIFYRDPNRMKYGTEHSLFTSSDKVTEYTSKLGYESQHDGSFDYGLEFTETPDMGSSATAASTVNVSFEGIKDTSFTYSSDTGLYTGAEYGSDLMDGTTNEAVKFKNLLVLYADTKILDDYGRRAVDLEGSGTGHFICNGVTIPIKWSHSGTGSSFTYTLADGTPLKLAVGKSYIAIVPTGSTITMQ
ncbi:MAG: DUF3048 domain-containing protein [Oscillospiraceae bacterium]|nr:DUF3048 domain-containing protein [Oscillospiraceae bacterium]